MLLKCLSFPKHGIKCSSYLTKRCKSHQLALVPEEEVKYPPIIDSTFSGKLRHKRQLWYDGIKAMPTVEQKLHEIVTKHLYFSEVVRVRACSPSYIGIPFQHYLTRTHIIHGLPEKLQTLNIDETYSNLKDLLCEAVENGLVNTWRDSRLTDWSEILSEANSGGKVIDNLVSVICKTLVAEHPHLLETTLDYQSKISSYWWHDGFQSPEVYAMPEDLFKSPYRSWEQETIAMNKQLAAETLCFQFEDEPYCAMRLNKPLPPIVPMDDALCSTAEVVDYNYVPKALGFAPEEKYYINCLPGMWPGDPYEYPSLQIYTLDKLKDFLSKVQYHNVADIKNGFGVMASFGWLNGLATFSGFTPFHDVTYPFVGQTILTNGQDWNFFIYQLNTIAFHADTDMKDRRNLCWSSGTMKLFESVEEGKLKGVNDDVLKTLLKFFTHTPKVHPNVQLKPYLGEETRTDEEILSMHAEIQKLYRNSPDIRASIHEIPLWQRVYKYHPLAPPCPSIKLK